MINYRQVFFSPLFTYLEEFMVEKEMMKTAYIEYIYYVYLYQQLHLYYNRFLLCISRFSYVHAAIVNDIKSRISTPSLFFLFMIKNKIVSFF